jgi:PAS domain S-box-containing protein
MSGRVYDPALPDDAALLKTGALQSAIFNSANFSSIATDEKGVIQIFNVGAERMLGYAAADVVNTITPADISDPQEVIARAEALSAELATTITPGFEALVFKASRGIEDIYQLTYIRKDGSRFPAIVSVTALRDQQGAIIGYLLIGTDNTARKQAEAEQTKLDQRLRDQQFYTRSLIESNIDALMTTNPAGIITDVNKQMEALTGCTRDELIGAPFKNYFTDPERAEAGIKLVLREKKITNYELTARARDGKTTVVSYNATTFYDRDRTLQGVFAAARDVTERKQIEQMLQEKNVELESAKSVAEQTVERLEEVERLKKGFLSTVSHELRTPLTSIRGSLGLLASGSFGVLSGEVGEIVAIAERNAVRLMALINDILDLERLETGKIELQFAQVPVESILRRAVESLAAFGQHGVTVEAAEASSMIWADADRIVQVLVNLLSNAVKFSPPGGVVKITVAPRESWVEFRVSDHGRGIPIAHRWAIFERFRQVETSDAREKGGTGLGLAICKSIVEQHGGTIGVDGEETGGSSFWFRVASSSRLFAPTIERPILVCGDRRGLFEEVITHAGRGHRRTDGGPMKVLIIDDDADIRMIAALSLGRVGGMDVVEAASGAEGVRKAQEERPDVILLDMMMPTMDGSQTLAALRSQPATATTPVIFLTAKAVGAEVDRMLALGAAGVLIKPFDPRTLSTDVRALVKQSQTLSASSFPSPACP